MVSLRPAGALVERDFRLLFAATSISAFGDLVATVALAFAVLDVGGASDLGVVLAVREGVSAVVLVFGGVLSDRLPRNRILLGASAVQGAAQAAMAATVLTGDATVLSFALLGALWGAGDGFVVPAEVGLIPQTITPPRLQQANALQGLSRGAVRVLGPAGGGVLVVALNPGWALAVDSLTFFVSAALLARIRIAPRAETLRLHYLQELRDGWKEFTSRTWLWSTVSLFSIGNLVFQFYSVLGPAIAEERLGGAGAWATILACGGVGSLAGSVLALRYRPRRPLVASIIASASIVPMFAALALVMRTEVIATTSFVFGLGITLHVTLWFTVFQRQVPEHAQSRVSSYDSLGSVVLAPFGAAIAGPLALAIGTSAALWLAAGVIVANTSTMLMIPAVRRIRSDSER
jgi:Major Facilitator Superfamily